MAVRSYVVACWSGVSLLTLAGLGLATYLAALYYTGHAATCGPYHGCEDVTGSDYAVFLGIPVTAMGVAAYSALLMGSLTVLGLENPPSYLKWGLLGMAGAGVAFSAYLTGIELLVLHAVCIYCVASAVLITVVFMLILATLALDRASWAGRPGAPQGGTRSRS